MTDAPERIWAKVEEGWHDGVTGEDFTGGTWDAGYHKDGTEYVRADLAKPKVKPLVWWTSDTGDEIATTILGRYQIQAVAANSRFRLFGPLCEIKNGIGYWPFKDAKAAAQADYECRILEALENTYE